LQALAKAKKGRGHFGLPAGEQRAGNSTLETLAAKTGLNREVLFFFCRQSAWRGCYQRELGRTHIFLLPSLRESVGLTMNGSHLSGCVPVWPVAADRASSSRRNAGFRFACAAGNSWRSNWRKPSLPLTADRKIISEKGRLAMQRIARPFSEENYRKPSMRHINPWTGRKRQV